MSEKPPSQDIDVEGDARDVVVVGRDLITKIQGVPIPLAIAALLIVVVALAFSNVIPLFAPTPPAPTPPAPTPTPLPFEPAAPGEFLVIVCDFDGDDGGTFSNSLYRRLVEEKLPNGVRIERLKGEPPLDDDQAVEIAQPFNATLVFYGMVAEWEYEPHYVITHDLAGILSRLGLDEKIKEDVAEYNRFLAEEAGDQFDVLVWFTLGQIAAFSNDRDLAIKYFDRALDNDLGEQGEFAGISNVHFHRGMLRRIKDDNEGALADYTAAIELGMSIPAVFNNRANVLYDLREFDAALEDVNVAIGLEKNYPFAYLTRGNIYRELGEFDEALADYTTAIELNPDYPNAYYNRALVYDEDGQGTPDQAIADYKRFLELASGEEGFGVSEEVLENANERKDALSGG